MGGVYAIPRASGVAKAGFAYRVRSLVYLRNRCAHLQRLWHHSVLDAGPTPNKVRHRAKWLVGQFGPRSVVDVIASMDDSSVRSEISDPVLPLMAEKYQRDARFWQGMVRPQSPPGPRSLNASEVTVSELDEPPAWVRHSAVAAIVWSSRAAIAGRRWPPRRVTA